MWDLHIRKSTWAVTIRRNFPCETENRGVRATSGKDSESVKPVRTERARTEGCFRNRINRSDGRVRRGGSKDFRIILGSWLGYRMEDEGIYREMKNREGARLRICAVCWGTSAGDRLGHHRDV